VLQLYENAQRYGCPEQILGLAQGLRPLGKQDLLPETRLLLALLPGFAHELRVCQGMRTMVRFRELLETVTIGKPAHHHNLTFFPLSWPQPLEPCYTLLTTAIEAGEAAVEECHKAGKISNLTVTNKAQRPLLIPEGEILIRAKQNRVVDVTALVAAGTKSILPVSCVEASRWRYQSRQLESKSCAPPALRHKKLSAVNRNRSTNDVVASDEREVWDEVRKCLKGAAARWKTTSLNDACLSAAGKLKELCKRLVLPNGAAGILVGHRQRIIGLDLFDSATTLKALWDRLADAYFLDALRHPSAAKPTSMIDAQRFLERLRGAAKPRLPALALGEELEIAGQGLVGRALLYEGRLCHLAAFSEGGRQTP
jgi:hypothetical protein